MKNTILKRLPSSLFILFTIFMGLHASAYTSKTLTLEDIMELTLCYNPTVQVAMESIVVAKGNSLQASLMPNPELMVELENFGGSKGLSGLSGAEITAGIQQTIETGGKRAYRTNVANYETSVAEERAVAQILRILSEAQFATVQHFVAKERLSLAQKRVKLADQTVQVVTERVDAARNSEIQREKAIIEQKTAHIERLNAEKDLRIAENRLERLVGTDEHLKNTDLRLTPLLPDRSLLLASIEETPQIRMLEFERLRAKSAINLAGSNAIPNPTLGLGVRRFNDNDSNALVATLSIPIPLFDRNQGRKMSAKAEYRKAESNIQVGVLSLQEEAKMTWEQLNVAFQVLESYKSDIVPSAERAYALATDGYQRGAFSFLELLDAQRTLYEVQASELDSLLILYKAKSKTDFLMGSYECFVRNRLAYLEQHGGNK